MLSWKHKTPYFLTFAWFWKLDKSATQNRKVDCCATFSRFGQFCDSMFYSRVFLHLHIFEENRLWSRFCYHGNWFQETPKSNEFFSVLQRPRNALLTWLFYFIWKRSTRNKKLIMQQRFVLLENCICAWNISILFAAVSDSNIVLHYCFITEGICESAVALYVIAFVAVVQTVNAVSCC